MSDVNYIVWSLVAIWSRDSVRILLATCPSTSISKNTWVIKLSRLQFDPTGRNHKLQVNMLNIDAYCLWWKGAKKFIVYCVISHVSICKTFGISSTKFSDRSPWTAAGLQKRFESQQFHSLHGNEGSVLCYYFVNQSSTVLTVVVIAFSQCCGMLHKTGCVDSQLCWCSVIDFTLYILAIITYRKELMLHSGVYSQSWIRCLHRTEAICS